MNSCTVHSRRSRLLTAAAAALATLTLAACSSSGSGSGSGSKGTIKVGGICDKTGPTPFPEACEAAKAYFDSVNSGGGVNGYKIDYVTGDGAGSAATSSSLGARMVTSDNVQAFVGGASLSGCTSITKLITTKKLYSLEGFAADNGCWASDHIMPTNTGALLGYLPLLHYLFDVEKKTAVCTMIPNTPSIGTARNAIKVFENQSGHKIKAELLWNPGGDLTPLVSSAKSNACDGVVLIGVNPVYVSVLTTAKSQKAFAGNQAALFSTGYTESLPKSLGATGEGAVTSSEFVAWSGDDKNLAEFKSLQAKAKFALSSISEGGYLAAKLFVDALKGIKGDITTEAIGKAMSGMKDADTHGLTAKKFTWGTYNVSSQYVQIKDGKWVPVSDDFYTPDLTADQAASIARGKSI